MNPSYGAYGNWGDCLREQAFKKEGKEADTLYQQAYEKLENAIKLNSNYLNAYIRWGVSLGNQAYKKVDTQGDELYQKAFEKYAEAVKIRPDYYLAYHNWGTDLLYQSKSKDGIEAVTLLKEALEKLKRSVELGGSSYYNIACIYALQNNKDKALENLETALNNKEITIDHVLNDEDWKNYLQDEDFKTLIEKYK